MTTRRVVELEAVPGLGRLYGRGGAGSARFALARALSREGGRPLAADALPAVEYTVHDVRASTAHLTAYQHLIGEPASDALPAGFVHVLAFPVATALMVRSDFPLPLVGMVHLANRVEQHDALRHTDALHVRAWTERLRPHRSGVQLDLVVEVRREGPTDPAEPPAWRGVSTYLSKGARLTGAEAPGERPPAPAVPHGLPTAVWTLPADTGRRYAAVSGDRNPIHLSALSARAFGFPRAIAHGMYTAARALADVGPRRGPAFTWTVQFAKPVLLPGTVTLQVVQRPGAGDSSADSALATGGFAYTGWDARRGTVHFTGNITPSGA
ncbi:MaoC like domain protein [mine drainage metagenome]|uniref:MaoC like domain protein n=1 Tax=mine drainage metagenome TaxID=410659 RepID=A0A1J5QEQ4_9ZZZZ